MIPTSQTSSQKLWTASKENVKGIFTWGSRNNVTFVVLITLLILIIIIGLIFQRQRRLRLTRRKQKNENPEEISSAYVSMTTNKKKSSSVRSNPTYDYDDVINHTYTTINDAINPTYTTIDDIQCVQNGIDEYEEIITKSSGGQDTFIGDPATRTKINNVVKVNDGGSTTEDIYEEMGRIS